jgi:hypothetical protein
MVLLRSGDPPEHERPKRLHGSSPFRCGCGDQRVFGVAWTASDPTWPSYYKDATGTVHLRGQATAVIDLFYDCGDGPAFPASAVLNLPPGYRPARVAELPAIFDGTPARVIVRPSGVVCRAGEADAGQYQAFDGISFRAED